MMVNPDNEKGCNVEDQQGKREEGVLEFWREMIGFRKGEEVLVSEGERERDGVWLEMQRDGWMDGCVVLCCAGSD